MDDKEKSLLESVTDTIKHTIDIATEAAQKALEPEPMKADEELVVVPAPAPVGADLLAPLPPIIVVAKKKRPKPAAKEAAKAPKAAKRTAKKAVKKSKTKSAVKKTSTENVTKKKTKRSASKKKTKKRTR